MPAINAESERFLFFTSPEVVSESHYVSKLIERCNGASIIRIYLCVNLIFIVFWWGVVSGLSTF